MQSAVKFQTKVWPEKLALGSDGSLWMTGKYRGVARLAPDGHVKLYRESLEDFAFDLTFGPDGGLWFAGDQLIGRIDQSGHRETWATDDYGIPRAITVADGAIWYAAAFNATRIAQIDTTGRTNSFVIKGPRAPSDIYGLTQGPDGALWFTEEGYHAPDGIGRITIGGTYQSWSLPGHPGPTRIAAGPDGALWFTERNRSAIGRITTAGTLTEFPLLASVTAHDITAGQDGALWFTTDSCIGRMTTSGQATTWHVRGAAGLDGIVAAPDGSFWLADPNENTVHHFLPPADNAPPLLPCGPRSVTIRSGSTVATVSYQLTDRFGKVDYFVSPRVQITRGGMPAFSEDVPKKVNELRGFDVEGASNAVTVRDLDGDGEPEVMLTLNWGGPHCCSWSRIYRYDALRRRYVAVEHFWQWRRPAGERYQRRSRPGVHRRRRPVRVRLRRLRRFGQADPDLVVSPWCVSRRHAPLSESDRRGCQGNLALVSEAPRKEVERSRHPARLGRGRIHARAWLDGRPGARKSEHGRLSGQRVRRTEYGCRLHQGSARPSP
jgi:virginiamycin B lyase